MPKRERCKYDNSFVSFETEDGKRITRSRCTICGKWSVGTFGYSLSYETPELCGDTRVKLCRSCAKKISPVIEQLAAFSWNARPGKDESEIGKLCDAATMEIFARWEQAIAEQEGDDE